MIYMELIVNKVKIITEHNNIQNSRYLLNKATVIYNNYIKLCDCT